MFDNSLNKLKSAAVDVQKAKKKLKRVQQVFVNTPNCFEVARERLKTQIITANANLKEAERRHKIIELEMEEQLEVA